MAGIIAWVWTWMNNLVILSGSGLNIMFGWRLNGLSTGLMR
ncbi:hypothetical protein [Nostoc sp. FACHB-892]|nr:hypothetical protein [Nostoc sp. FACHB-892]